MDASQMRKLQETLIQRREDLLIRIQAANEKFREYPPYNRPINADFFSGEICAEEGKFGADQLFIKRALQMVGAIEIALRNMKNSQYGICRMCRREIPVERLKSVPETVRCVKCQTMVESSFKSFS